MNEFIEILKNDPDKAFDYIANNGYQFSKDELVNIAKELIYGFHCGVSQGIMTKKEHNELLGGVADELEETYGE